MKASLKSYINLVCFVTLTLLFSTSTANSSSATSLDRFQLVILKQDWYDLKLGHKYTQALPTLKSANTADSLFLIGTNEVEAYNWTRQSITLTGQATAKLIQALPRDEDLKKHIQYMAKVKREHGWGNPIEPALHLKGFLATLNDELIYAGICLEPMSELTIDYPVIRPGMVDSKAVLHLLPIQIPFVAYDPVWNESAAWDAAIAPEGVRVWGQFPAQMKSHFMSIGTRPEAMEFRNLIKNPRVRELMEQAGKLSQ